jgi:hypothetical protein
MQKVVFYYFESLPIHPQPKPLESFTGYLIRLAEENYLDRSTALSRLFWDRRRFAQRQGDYPPGSFGRLTLAAACDEASLLKLTFYHLARKFNHSIDANAVASFLKQSLSQTLRFCPMCVKEYSFYSLTWRFLCLPGCADHGCRLLEGCSHCGHTLSLLPALMKIGICPLCRGDLRTCSAEPLTQHEWTISRARAVDLSFLLTPQSWEASPELLAALGREYACQRKNKQLRQSDIDTLAEFPQRTTHFLEYSVTQGRSNLPRHSVSFERYLGYADFLGFSLTELFTTALSKKAVDKGSSTVEQVPKVQRHNYQAKEDKQVEYLQQALEGNENNTFSGPQQRRGKEIGVNAEVLRQKGVITSVEQNVTTFHGRRVKEENLREQEWLTKVHLAYKQLAEGGKRITVAAICQTIPASPETLSKYSRVKAFLLTIVEEGLYQAQRRKAQKREEACADAVQDAIDQLKTRGQLVTLAAIAELLHTSVHSLRRYSSVRILIDQIAVEERLAQANLREEAYLKQIQEATHLLEAQGQRVTPQAVGEILRLRIHGLIACYPRIKALWQELRTERACQQQLQREQREELLLGQAQAIIDQWDLEKEPITADAIGMLMGMSVSGLKRYKRVGQLLGSIFQANRANKASR